jgi:hypothetical protein
MYSDCGSEVGIGEIMDRNALRLYGFVERMKEERIVKRVYNAKVEDRTRGSPEMRWMDSVKANLERNECRRGEKVRAKVRGEWKRVVNS